MDNETIEAIRQLLTPINNKLDSMDLKISEMKIQMDSLKLDMKTMEYENQKRYRELKQDTETIMTVLEARNLLPKHYNNNIPGTIPGIYYLLCNTIPASINSRPDRSQKKYVLQIGAETPDSKGQGHP